MMQQDREPPELLDDEATDDDEVYDLDIDESSEDPEGLMNEALAALDEARDTPREHGVAVSRSEGAELTMDATAEEESRQRLQQEVEALRERSLRTLADYENYRRRSERERDELRRYAGSEILREFLTVMDNLERALAATGSLEDLTSGVEMIHKQMIDLLRRYGVEPIEAAGQPFDPMVHEAVAREVDASIDHPIVKQEMQRGYQMYDRLLRPSIVQVAVPPEEGNGSGESE